MAMLVSGRVNYGKKLVGKYIPIPWILWELFISPKALFLEGGWLNVINLCFLLSVI